MRTLWSIPIVLASAVGALYGPSVAHATTPATGSSPQSGANLTVAPGITSATFPNTARGTLEICKLGADSETNNAGDFYFLINNSITIHTPAGLCVPALNVPVGTATILEEAKPNYHLVSVTATGPDGSNRIVSGRNPVTVSVPFGGVGNETLVTFTNAVNTGTYKICKTSSNSALQNTVFTFSSKYFLNGVSPGVATDKLKPGQCSGTHGPIPVLNDSQSPVLVITSESGSDDVYVASIRYQGNGSQNSTSGTGTSNVDNGASETFNIGRGQNVVTYDNEVFIDNDGG